MSRATLLDTLQWAYGVQTYQVIGPKWLSELRFDFNAKAGGPVSESELKAMLVQLLKDRFQLKSHTETREFPALSISVGKDGHKLKVSDPDGKPRFTTDTLTLAGTATNLAPMADFLSRVLQTPVVDQSDLEGKFDYAVDIQSYITEDLRRTMPQDGSPPIEAQGIIAKALQEGLGLRLESKKLAVPVIVIDALEKAPSEN